MTPKFNYAEAITNEVFYSDPQLASTPLDRYLGESEQYRIKNPLKQQRIKNILRQQVIKWNKNNATRGFDSTENTVNLRPNNSLNFVAKDIKVYFRAGKDSFVNEILDNYPVEIQVKDFQHSSLCSCCSCGSNQINATQEGSRFENVAFFNGTGGKWSQPGGLGNVVNITYSYSNLLDGSIVGISNSDIKTAIEEAFGVWSSVAPLNFTEVEDSSGNSQIRIGQEYIDGRSGTLAFAYFPTNGDIRFDNGENWNRSLFLETAVHEIGHSLGLDHESGTSAIMNPTIQNRYNGLGTAFLYQDDINGIRSIYGSGNGSVNPLVSTPPTPTPDSTTTPSGFDGTNGDDVLIGNSQPNLIRGFGGNDYIEGGFGIDTLDGGQGNDTVSYSYGSSAFTWDMSTDRLNFRSGASETVRNFENVIGSKGSDRIITNGVDNTIEGGNGADAFVFSSLDGSFDRIVDYSRAEGDIIEVSRLGFGTGSRFSYSSGSGILYYGNQEFVVLENKPTFSDVAAGFVVS